MEINIKDLRPGDSVNGDIVTIIEPSDFGVIFVEFKSGKITSYSEGAKILIDEEK